MLILFLVVMFITIAPLITVIILSIARKKKEQEIKKWFEELKNKNNYKN